MSWDKTCWFADIIRGYDDMFEQLSERSLDRERRRSLELFAAYLLPDYRSSKPPK